jgi:hypothetical protein
LSAILSNNATFAKNQIKCIAYNITPGPVTSTSCSKIQR